MALSAGERIGPYEILAAIGKGGMGEVFRARDPRTGRDVAIKISAVRISQFSERFNREVRAIGPLNHPNICHIYDVGPNYLVMELVEGPTLAERIKQGPVPWTKRWNCTPDRRGVGSRAREGDRSPRSEAGQHQDPARRHR